MPCTQAYKEHIMYIFNGLGRTVMRYEAITAWLDRSRWRKTDECFEAPYEEYPITICG